MDPDSSGSPEKQIADLRARVLRLEAALRRQGIAFDDETKAALPGVREIPVQEAGPAPLPATPELPVEPSALLQPMIAAAKEDRSLESRIGSQWFNRVGILAVLIGMAWFLKLAIDNHWIGPAGRVIIGLIAGAALIAWSERFRSRGFAAFSYSLKALGSGILYLSLWAAYRTICPDFEFNRLRRHDRGHCIQRLHVLGAELRVAGFVCDCRRIQHASVLSNGENHELTLFSYLLLLNVAVLVLVVLRPWSRLLFGAFTGTVLFFLGWSIRFYSDAQFGRTAFFLSVFFLIFAFAPRLVRLPNGDVPLSGADSLAVVGLPLLNAAFGFIGFYAMLQSTGAASAQPWVAVAFGAFYLLILRLPNRGALRTNPSALSALHLTIAVAFLTIAIPLKAHGRWITVGWLVEGAALLWLARRVASRLLRGLALTALVLGLAALIVIHPAASTTIVFNQRFGTYLVGVLVFAFVARLPYDAEGDPEPEFAISWPVTGAVALLIVNVLILVAIGWEIHNYWWFVRYSGDWAVMRDYRMYAQFTYSALFMIFGAIQLAVGFWRRSAFLRWQALILLAISIAKVFLVDVSQLSQGYRIVSFLGLGALLLAVSFVYQKDWLNLRGLERHPQ